ncbi:hypothetical protein E3Q15_02614 [Wallemia mellicola]|nr:hypothetical protein E3Q15_02614 [Wallemia mellicola]TIC55659.1 hypothetical protein E3Q05_02111 [Wallemia mellicola]
MVQIDTETQNQFSNSDKMAPSDIEKKDIELAKKLSDSDSQLDDGSIKEKSLTWPQASFLLLLEYIVIALLALPSSWATLGYGGGTIATIVLGIVAGYTQHVLWRFCLKFPEVRDILDVAVILAGGGTFTLHLKVVSLSNVIIGKWGRIAWFCAFVGLVLNNVAIMGLHVVQFSVSVNTLSEGAKCTQVFAVCGTLLMFILSLMRELKQMSLMGAIASSTMLLCIVLAMIFAGVQGLPANHSGGPIILKPWDEEGGVEGLIAGNNAALNIAYTYIGHILIPSFVADMKNPKDFDKAIYVSIIAEIILFSLAGGIIYSQIGATDMTSPAYGSLQPHFKKAIAAFVLPTVVIVGGVYCLVTAKTVFARVFDFNSVHRRSHTVKGWSAWIGIITVLWILAYIIGQAIPFFNDLISLISSLFDSWFGFIFWGVGYFFIYRGKSFSRWGIVEGPLNILMIIAGFVLLGLGTYTSVESIRESYASGSIKSPFSCVNNGY